MRGVFLSLGIVTAIVVEACANTGTGAADNDVGDEFNPAGYPRDCTEDSDCVRVTPVSMCATCCTADVAVKRGQAERDYADATQSCRGIAICLAGCPDVVPACVDQKCTLKAQGT